MQTVMWYHLSNRCGSVVRRAYLQGGSAPSDSGATSGQWIVLDGEASPWQFAALRLRVFFLSNNAFNRQVSHSKEGRSSQARYTFINLGSPGPFYFSLPRYIIFCL
jgi:hypothetical protein